MAAMTGGYGAQARSSQVRSAHRCPCDARYGVGSRLAAGISDAGGGWVGTRSVSWHRPVQREPAETPPGGVAGILAPQGREELDEMPPSRPQFPPPPPVPPPTRPVPPADIDTARLLWWAVSALAVASGVCALFGLDRRELAGRLYDSLRHGSPNAAVTMAQAQGYVWAVVVVGGVLALVVWLLVALLAHRMRRGALWARSLLTLIGAFEVVSGIFALTGAGSTHGVVAMVDGGLGVVQAVLAAGAIFLMYRPESNRYFHERVG